MSICKYKETTQVNLLSYLKQNLVNIPIIQKHNIKDDKEIEYLAEHYHILNKSLTLIGSILIVIDKKYLAPIN